MNVTNNMKYFEESHNLNTQSGGLPDPNEISMEVVYEKSQDNFLAKTKTNDISKKVGLLNI